MFYIPLFLALLAQCCVCFARCQWLSLASSLHHIRSAQGTLTRNLVTYPLKPRALAPFVF